MKRKKVEAIAPAIPGVPTDLETAGLFGKVKEISQTVYKAHNKSGEVIQGKIENDYSFHEKNFIASYNEQGRKVTLQEFGKNGKHVKTFDDKSRMVEELNFMKGELYQTSVHNFNVRGELHALIITNADGTLSQSITNNYDENGKQLSAVHLGEGGKLLSNTVRTYDEKGNWISIIEYDGEGVIKHQSHFKYNDAGKRTEESTEYSDIKMKEHNRRITHKYNKQGDAIETVFYNGDGTVKAYHHEYEYDSDGKKIVPVYIPYVEQIG